MNRVHKLTVFFCLSFFLVPNLRAVSTSTAAAHITIDNSTTVSEAFDPSLYQQIRSVDALLSYAQEHWSGPLYTLEFFNYLDRLISRRFYHGYSHYTYSDNWTAALMGKYVWSHLSAIVIPDDIMKFPNAACSQQSIVFMACAERMGVDFRRVTFPHHYALELKIGGKWYYFDANLEIQPETRRSFDEHLKAGELYGMYSSKMTREAFTASMGSHHYGERNETPALHATLFHWGTGILSQSAFYILVFLLVRMAYLYVYLKGGAARLQEY